MNKKIFASLEQSISKERLSHYSNLFQTNDKSIILEKYLLNVELSKSLYLPIQNLELTFRNNIHTVLSNNRKDEFWFEDKTFMLEKDIKKINDVKRRIQKNKKITAGRIISELSFGFWSILLTTDYEQKIWNKYIRQILPNIPKLIAKRKGISRDFNTIKNLRNKIFHFDTIIDIKNLFELHKLILEFIYWLNEDMYNLTIAFDEFDGIYKNEEEIIKEKLESLSRRANEKL